MQEGGGLLQEGAGALPGGDLDPQLGIRDQPGRTAAAGAVPALELLEVRAVPAGTFQRLKLGEGYPGNPFGEPYVGGSPFSHVQGDFDSDGILDLAVATQDPFGTTEAIDVRTALRSYTIWAAHQIFQDDRIGSIEVGKEADLAVWDRDPYAVPTAALKDMRAELTLVKGRTVYRAPTFRSAR